MAFLSENKSDLNIDERIQTKVTFLHILCISCDFSFFLLKSLSLWLLGTDAVLCWEYHQSNLHPFTCKCHSWFCGGKILSEL